MSRYATGRAEGMSTAAYKIKALAPWFGSKRGLAARIVAELGEHKSYWSPFCGSMAVLLAKPACQMETVNDLHGGLINLACVIRDPVMGPQLYRRLRRVIMHEDIFTASNEITKRLQRGELELSPVEHAEHFFISAWMGRNGCAGMPASWISTYCVRYTKNGGHAGTRWNNAVQSIPGWRARLRNVVIVRRDAFDLLDRIEDAEGVAIYCDPPYIVKKGKYLHDFIDDDHRRLAELLTRFKRTRVVLSYYDHPLLEELYPHWSRLNITVSKAMSHGNKRGANQTKATEVLLINGDSYTQPNGLF